MRFGFLYPELAKASPDYSYMGEAAEKVRSRIKDLDYLSEESASALIGDPHDCVRQIKRCADLGAQEVFLAIDGMPHDKIMRSLGLLGKYVIPQSKKISAYP